MSCEYEFESASKSALEIFSGLHINLSAVAVDLMRPDMPAGDYLQKLVDHELSKDALMFLAFVLPTRYAVWWGCLGLEHLCDYESLNKEEQSAFRAAIAWVVDPNEERRAAADQWGTRAPTKSPFRWLARSAGFIDFPLPKPKHSKRQDFQARGVYMALSIALALVEVATKGEDDDAWVRVLAIGLDVSRGKNLWPKVPTN